MAIQPIDLQILFSQIEKVGKTQADATEGVKLQQAVQGAVIQRKLDERTRSVNETKDTGEGAEPIKDDQARDKRNPQGKAKQPETDGESDTSEIITDPGLGRMVDLSG